MISSSYMQLQLSLTKEEAAAAAALAAQQSDQALRITNTVPNPSKPPPVKLASHPPNPALVATVKENSRRRKMRQEQANRLRTALKIEASTPKDNCHRVSERFQKVTASCLIIFTPGSLKHHHHDCVEDIVKRNRSDKIKINANRLLDASSRLWKVDDAPWGYYKQPSKSSSEGQAGDDAGWSLFEENEKHQRFFEELQECTMPLEERIILPEISQELTIPKYVTPKKKKEITQIAFGSKVNHETISLPSNSPTARRPLSLTSTSAAQKSQIQMLA